jgi:predicted SAM-dependent methyltransferase
MAEHVWEHLTDHDTALANKNCFQYLKPGGVLRLAVPDGFNPSKEYIEYVRPGGTGPGADDHKVLYTYQSMKERLERAGFKINTLEYWDENGKFYYIDWTDEGGRIRRSRRYDPRNQDGRLHYTSLIVDAIKPLNS